MWWILQSTYFTIIIKTWSNLMLSQAAEIFFDLCPERRLLFIGVTSQEVYTWLHDFIITNDKKYASTRLWVLLQNSGRAMFCIFGTEGMQPSSLQSSNQFCTLSAQKRWIKENVAKGTTDPRVECSCECNCQTSTTRYHYINPKCD